MQSDQLKEITVIVAENGTWREEKVSLGASRGDREFGKSYSPWQWKRMYREHASDTYGEAMDALRDADNKIRGFSNELKYFISLLPKDPTKLPDIALILGAIDKKLSDIKGAGEGIKDVRNKSLSDFYGSFSIEMPSHLKQDAQPKVATASLIGDFISYLGRKIFEYTDPEIREMKRAVSHLIGTTQMLVKSIDSYLDDMLKARKTGDVAAYIDSLKLIAQDQAEFKTEYSKVYDAYLKESYIAAITEYQSKHGDVKPEQEKVHIEQDESGEGHVVPSEEMEDVPSEDEAIAEERVRRQQAIDMSREEGAIPEAPPSQEPPAEQPEAPEAPAPPPAEQTPSSKPKQEGPSEIDQRLSEGVTNTEEEQKDNTPDINKQIIEALQAKSSTELILDKAENARFLARLGRIAETENKYIVAAFMAKYSEALEDSNPKASEELLLAAQSILND
jgi:hypothetical protein